MKNYLMLVLVITANLYALDKASFDVGINPGLGKSAALQSVISQATISNGIIECCVLPGGYFTVGISGGKQTASFADNSPLLFGHPFARTSYPLFRINNIWGQMEDFCTLSSGTFTATDTEITYSCPVSKSGVISVHYHFDSSSDSILTITSEFVNTSSDSLDFQYAVVMDPGTGISSGDGIIQENNQNVINERKIGSLPVIREQCLGGNGISFIADLTSANEVYAANWKTVKLSDKKGVPLINTGNSLYDLCLKAMYKSVNVGSSKTCSQSVKIKLNPFIAPQKLFVRWDIPRSVDLCNGLLYPQNIQSKCIIYNPTSTDIPVNISFSLPSLISLDTANFKVTAVANNYTYVPVSLNVYEHYTSDTIGILCLKADKLSDSLNVPVFLPASPFSSNGLKVTIDSLVSQSTISRKATFKAFDSSSGSYIYNLRDPNVFLFENNLPVNSFSLTKDTTGGKGNLDVVFVLDVTGSMSGEINAVKNNISTFAGNLTQAGINYRIGMVTFLDEIENVYQPTANVDVFSGYISSQNAHAGGDEPENSLAALDTAAGLSLRPDAKTIFIWITDATYHNPISNLTVQKVVAKLAARDITVFSIGPSNLESAWYQPIYSVTGGKFFDIDGNFQDILLDIANLRFSNNYLLSYNSAIPFTNLKSIRIDLHYAGSGGSDTINFNNGSALKKTAEILSVESGTGKILFNCGNSTRVKLSIYNILGKEVFANDYNTGGLKDNQVLFNSEKTLATGLYICKIGWLDSNLKKWQFKSHTFSIIGK